MNKKKKPSSELKLLDSFLLFHIKATTKTTIQITKNKINLFS